MAILVWDQVGDRVYETGVDRGVLYLADETVVPWNGLTSVTEKNDKQITPVYFDGMKINNLITLGDFEATLRAITYPDEFAELEGLGKITGGLFFGEQPTQTFALSYRTRVGDDLNGYEAGYKIHLIYNATAIPSDKQYSTIESEYNLTEFEWNITTVPEEVPGFRPTAYVVIDSTKISASLLEELEGYLYGSDVSVASLIPIYDLLGYLYADAKWRILETEGLWSATTPDEDLIEWDDDDPTMFTLLEVDATFLTADTYIITDSFYGDE